MNSPSFDGNVSQVEQEKTEMDSGNHKISKFPNLFQRYFGTLVDYILVFFCGYYVAVNILPQSSESSVPYGVVLLAIFLYDSVLTERRAVHDYATRSIAIDPSDVIDKTSKNTNQ